MFLLCPCEIKPKCRTCNQVLNTALTRLYGVHLVSAGSESVGKISTTGYDGESSFVLNRHAHWVAIRSIGGAYWDLNSMLDYPSE